MTHQEMTLNIRYDLPQGIWENVVPDIYREMEGWVGYNKSLTEEETLPCWFSFNENEKHICASLEPSGLQFSGLMKGSEWEEWKSKFKRIATRKLGFKIGEAALGEV